MWVGCLVAQHVDEHRGEAVDGVGVLAGVGREVLRGQRVERAVGQRMSVEEEQARRVRHVWQPRPHDRQPSPCNRPPPTALADVDGVNEIAKGTLHERMGIVFTEISHEHAVARMPVAGNTQPYGLLHGGASVVLAEGVGSFLAVVLAGEGRAAVGVDINATHHRPATSGWVTAVARPLCGGAHDRLDRDRHHRRGGPAHLHLPVHRPIARRAARRDADRHTSRYARPLGRCARADPAGPTADSVDDAAEQRHEQYRARPRSSGAHRLGPGPRSDDRGDGLEHGAGRPASATPAGCAGRRGRAGAGPVRAASRSSTRATTALGSSPRTHPIWRCGTTAACRRRSSRWRSAGPGSRTVPAPRSPVRKAAPEARSQQDDDVLADARRVPGRALVMVLIVARTSQSSMIDLSQSLSLIHTWVGERRRPFGLRRHHLESLGTASPPALPV
jgi:1,4-dihydroxy-2-naphthoyl-CoA hydrolase